MAVATIKTPPEKDKSYPEAFGSYSCHQCAPIIIWFTYCLPCIMSQTPRTPRTSGYEIAMVS